MEVGFIQLIQEYPSYDKTLLATTICKTVFAKKGIAN